MDNQTKVITAHLPLALAARVDEMAARLQRSRGWIMKQAVEAWIDRMEANSGAQGPAEAQAAAGQAAAAEAAETLKTLRATTTLGDISWRELRDAGRQ